MKKKAESSNQIAENRKAKFNFSIEDTFECGMVLLGNEVKSLRARRLNFADSYAFIKNDEIFIIGLRIEKFDKTTHEEVNPERTRKLLLHKKEIRRIQRILKNKKATLVPLKLYLKNSRVKLLLGIGVGKGKKDKREAIKERDVKKELSRVLKKAR